MFHEDHQIPEYRDGLEAVVDPLGDDDIDPDEIEQIKQRFEHVCVCVYLCEIGRAHV